MKAKTVYEPISRVVSEDKEVIGFMMKQKYKKSAPIFMSVDVVTFGLTYKNFEIVNVKLGGNGKPRGCNGFLLSKLPIEGMDVEEEVNKGLFCVLSYVINEMSIDSKIHYMKNKDGINATYMASFRSSDYNGMELETAEEELNRLMKYYYKHLPKDYKNLCDKLTASISENDIVSVVVFKSLVQEAKGK